MRTPKHLQKPDYKRQGLGQHSHRPKRQANTRIVIGDDKTYLWAWPSRGGLIVLGNATALDFTFLGLDPVNPPATRNQDQDAEDVFCQQLLRLGAKWFDSVDRYRFVAGVCEDEEPQLLALEAEEEADLTLMERRWVSVGWPSGGRGDFWVAEYDQALYKILEPKNMLPSEASQVHLARTMDEKCAILEGLGAKHYQSIKEYQGAVCLNAWEEKTSGEVGPLVKLPITSFYSI
ncbi:hypothetical protein BJ166DRAFT_338808 [Pestalotiopsis sp. NC0098]|nr:hypothetical protein BJ166DRAFT_338808 [Pestalotiopsis sp. NC0098]